ncbi:MAG TPA: Y-family DNA polymerase [Oligoflexia bacterium]|nr:Y-family DNA polymerase [Oligoflexia bacterium]HMR24833.1 Y-family DNA polymerase [Oligoflexia bacterium]
MNQKHIALVDCNNFYASCERVFQPQLINKPIVVLSNNDGCIIARSNEAKALDIPMGAPIFKHKDIIQKHRVKLFSTNFALYGDMSRRVMQCLSQWAEHIEIYSIDEAFLYFKGLSSEQVLKECLMIEKKIMQWTGIPVSIGLAHSKTLAKAAAVLAKKEKNQHVFDLRQDILVEKVLQSFELEDLWGLSYRGARHWRALGLYTPLDIKHSEPLYIRRKMGVVGERLVYELNGHAVLEREKRNGKKNIMSSRSFPKKVTRLIDLYRAVANYTFRACQKLREQHSYAQSVYIFIRSSTHLQHNDYYKNGCSVILPSPSQDVSFILNQIKPALRAIYKPGVRYHKAGIILMDLIKKNEIQSNIFCSYGQANNEKTMQIIDQINQKAGKDIIFLAAQGNLKKTHKNNIYKSPSYTTNWKELLRVR